MVYGHTLSMRVELRPKISTVPQSGLSQNERAGLKNSAICNVDLVFPVFICISHPKTR